MNIFKADDEVLRKIVPGATITKSQVRDDYMEETMLKGMVIGLLKENPLTLLPIIKDFVNEIDNWSVCDCFCCGLKFTKNNKELMWNFIQPYFKSKKEYEIRFGCVMLLNYFVEEKYLDRIFCIIENIKTEDYYAKMAIAWLLSICYIKFPQITMNFLRITKINNWIYNKTIQKITESYRITTDTKQILKSLKR